LIQPAWALEPANSSISGGSTGMTIPIATMSRIAITTMKTIAALRPVISVELDVADMGSWPSVKAAPYTGRADSCQPAKASFLTGQLRRG
jgi:hypothetical protein